MNIGLFGGSFDPVHSAHVAVVRTAKSALQLDKLFIIPCQQQALKPHSALPGADRLAMLHFAFDKEEKVFISTLELSHSGPSYTIDTLRYFKKEYPDDRLFLIVGADSAIQIPAWREWEHFFDYAHLLIVSRPNYPLKDLPEGLRARMIHNLSNFQSSNRGRVACISMPDMPIASSDIRERVRQGRPLEHLVSEEVNQYIQDKQLYREEKE